MFQERPDIAVRHHEVLHSLADISYALHQFYILLIMA
jgi:hypothetical protein